MDSHAIREVLEENNLEIPHYYNFHVDRFDFLLELLEKYYKPGSAFLDIGSFKGYLMIGASLMGYKVSGTDLRQYVEEIQGLSDKFAFTNCPADLSKEVLPFTDNSFDIIVCSEVLEHFNFHPGKVFAEISRVLKSGGLFIVTSPNLIRLNNVFKLIAGVSINAELDIDWYEGTHYREYNSTEVCYLMQQAGLNVVEAKTVNFKYPGLGKMVAVTDTLSVLFPQRKRDLCVIGEKS